MTLGVYWGEFSVSPIPLEASLNYCSHGCAFCFANLNTPDRTADMPAITRLLTEFATRKSVEAMLLRGGYPVLVSNKVDPFAHSNYRQAVPMLELMTELDIPVAIQTRGGRGIDDVLSFAPPSVWYVSISQTDDALRARIEPGAPPIEERFELIAKLRERGHRVVLGLNPVVPEWTPDPEPLLARAKAAGAEGAWIEPLHLSHRQAGRMSEREKAAVTLPIIGRALKRRLPVEDLATYELARRVARDVGLEVFSIGQWTPSDFWRPYRETYANLFPTMQEFVNACWEKLEEGDVIRFEDFAACFDDLPDVGEPLNILHYIGAKAHDILAERRLPPKITYRQLLAVIFAEPRLSFCPARLRCFAYAARREGDGWIQYVDEAGLPLLVFTREPLGFDEYFTELEEAA